MYAELWPPMRRLLFILLLTTLNAWAVGPITVSLNPGWNGVALQCTQVTSLSAPNEVAGLAAWNGSVYDFKNFTQQELNNIGGRKAIWVFATGATAFTYSGTDESTTVNLSTGWNMVSFARTNTIPGSSVAASVSGQPVNLGSQVLPAFQQINANNTYSGVDVTAGGTLQPGRPYWIFALNSNIQLNYSGTGPTPTPTPTPTPNPTPTPAPTPTPISAGLQLLNSLRSQANLPGVTEIASLTNGCNLHANWQILNNVLQQGETPGTPGYTQEGDLAGQQSNLAVANTQTTIQQDINGLMTAPFHGLLFLDPLWRGTGIGHANSATANIKGSSAINVLGDRHATLPSGITFPIMWPANGSTINLTSYSGGDSPDPLSNFPQITAPTGPPIYVLTGLGNTPPNVTAVSLFKSGTQLNGVVFDQTNYTNSNAAAQQAGRAVLAQRNTVVILPRAPFTAGTYQCSLTNNGQTFSWTFNVSP